MSLGPVSGSSTCLKCTVPVSPLHGTRGKPLHSSSGVQGTNCSAMQSHVAASTLSTLRPVAKGCRVGKPEMSAASIHLPCSRPLHAAPSALCNCNTRGYLKQTQATSAFCIASLCNNSSASLQMLTRCISH